MMQAALRSPIKTHWTAPVSLVAHCLALVVLALLGRPRPLNPPMTRVIAVDLLPSRPLAVPSVPAPAAAPSSPGRRLAPVVPAASVAAAQARPVSRDGDVVHATDLRAAAILADPANAQLRHNFEALAGSEQVIQLCNIEALEQIRPDDAGPIPDAVVGYAFADMAVDGLVLTAEGGAYRRRQAWFRVRYRCTVAADMTAVTGFDYALGEPIPPGEWEEHFLNADDEGLEP